MVTNTSSTGATKHITPTKWERHKEAIINLRRSGIVLEGDDGIMATMKREHGFVASSSQYELQLNKWAERKNLHADEWRQIIQTVDQYNEDGIKCDVYRNGQLIPQWTLKRKRKEYCSEGHDESVKRCQVRAPCLPEFIEFRTSNSPSTHRARGFADFSVHNKDLLDGIYTINSLSVIDTNTDVTAVNVAETDRREILDLDSGDLVSAINPKRQEGALLTSASSAETHHTTQSLRSQLPWEVYGSSAEVFPFELDPLTPLHEQFPSAELEPDVEVVNTGLSVARLSDVVSSGCSIPNKHATLERNTPARQNAIPLGREGSPGDLFDVDLIDTWTSRIPFLQFEEHLQSQGNLYLNTKFTACVPQPADNRQTDLMAFDCAEESGNSSGSARSTHERSAVVQGGSSTATDSLTRPEMFNSALLSLLPPDAISSAFVSRTTTQHPAFPSSFHRSLVFSISNNFAGLEGVPMGAVLEYLAKDTYMHLRLMKYLRAGPKYVCKAIAENLIRAAIENCDATLVTALMSTGFVAPDEILFAFEGRRYTAVERSAMLGSIEVTKALLVAGAAVNKTYTREGPLNLAILTTEASEPVDIDLVNLLLECGAQVRPDLLSAAVRDKDGTLFRSLISNFSRSQCHEYLRNDEYDNDTSFIDMAVRLLDCELATMAVSVMLQACFQTGCGKCIKSPGILRRSISAAAMRGFSEIVILLLEYTPKEDLPLAAAVRGGHKDLIELLLEQGAEVDTPAFALGADKTWAYTPLAEAIRGGDDELVHDFESRGALSQISEPGRFRAAIYAAAEAKNIAYVQRLLQIAHGVPGDIMDLALETSVQKRHDDIAILLLKAGADVNVHMSRVDDRSYVYKDDIAPLMALRRKNEILVRAIMGCNMKVNLSWGDVRLDSPLLLAARWGNLGVIKGLLSMGADVDGDGKIDEVLDRNVDTDDGGDKYGDRYDKTYLKETAVTAAVKESNKPLVELLVKKHQASLNSFSDRKTSPLAAAISNKDVGMFRYLLELGADPACHSAFKRAILLDRGMFPELLHAFRAKYPMGKPGFGSEPLRIAIARNDGQVLDALLEAKLDVNAFASGGPQELNSLGTAIRKHGRYDLNIIRKLISAGGDPEGIVERGGSAIWGNENFSLRTALLEAIATKNKALVELLVEAGADPNRPAQFGIDRTPLQHACEVGSLEIVEFLLGRGADINEEPAFRGGGTSLQLCAITGCTGVADKLLRHGADVHAPRPDIKGRTALEGAAEHGRLDMLKILWDATAGQGFDAEQVNRAMKLAEENGHFACRDFIEQLRLVGRALSCPSHSTFDHSPMSKVLQGEYQRRPARSPWLCYKSSTRLPKVIYQ